MRISDWSSDVCSSDLKLGVGLRVARLNRVNVDFALAHARAGDLDVTEIYDGIDQRESLLERLAADVVGEKEARLVVKDRFGRWIFLLCLLGRCGLSGCLRSEVRRVGTECVGTCRFRWSA